MIKIFIEIAAILFVALAGFPQVIQASGSSNGVDDLRGRWDVDWAFIDQPDEIPAPLTWLVQDIEPSPTEENVFLANGCMRTSGSGGLAPLSLVATYQPGSNSYDLLVYSTVIPPEGEPFVVRFSGNTKMNGKGVSDDESNGVFVTEFAKGDWLTDHHDRRRPKCKGVETFTQEFGADVYAHQDLADGRVTTVLETYTHIVSSAMLVVEPDGGQVLAELYTDIFSPDVDFVSEFRFVLDIDAPPMTGDYYHFILLDLLGNPIPGADDMDIWNGCSQRAPENLQAEYLSEYADLAWNAVPVVPGEFDPGADPQIGFYQIHIFQMFDGMALYGSGGIRSSSHQIPWDGFEPGQENNGVPDGIDFGIGLGEFADGNYQVVVESFAQSNPSFGGHGLECSVRDSTQNLMMTKEGSDLSFEHLGSVSGMVFDKSGNPLGGIAVDIEEGGYGTCTDEYGRYEMHGLPLGIYNVVAGRNFCESHSYVEQMIVDVELTSNIPDVGSVDFYLELGGSISGTVFDKAGNPLGGIAVDIEEGGYGTCTDEYGRYEMRGLPLGTYNVVAGRRFCGPHPYIEQMAADIVLTTETPDFGDVDFYLVLGGSISGVVTASSDGRPLVSIQVGAHIFDDPGAGFWDALTDLDGSYTISGLPSGDFRVFVDGEFGWQNLAYDQQTDFASADRVTVSLEMDTPGTDFQLMEDGSVTLAVTVPSEGVIKIAAILASCWDGSQDVYDAFQMAIADYGPIQGFNVTHNDYNAGCDQWGGKWAVEDVVSNPQNVGVIGLLYSSQTVGGLPVLQTAGVVMISPSNTGPALSDYGPSVFNRTVVEGGPDHQVYEDWNARVSDLESVSAWEADFQATYGRPPNEWAKYAYDAAILLLTRIDEVADLDTGGNLVIDRAALAAAVRATIGWSGVTGDVTLDPGTGNRVDTLGGG